MLLFEFNTWWGDKDLFEQVYWVFAIPSTLVFLIMLLLTFIGGDMDDAGSVDSDVDADHGIGFQFFTLKNLVGFFTIFSWVGLACIDAGMSTFGTILSSFLSGLVMMILMASIFYFMSKLTDSGTLNVNNAIGGIGEIYLPVGKNRSGFGKVQINIQGGMRTLQAMTDDDDDLPVGTIVKVSSVINDQILVVTKNSNS